MPVRLIDTACSARSQRHSSSSVASGCIPVGLLGTALGLKLCQRISSRQFALALNLLLSAAGLSFLL